MSYKESQWHLHAWLRGATAIVMCNMPKKVFAYLKSCVVRIQYIPICDIVATGGTVCGHLL